MNNQSSIQNFSKQSFSLIQSNKYYELRLYMTATTTHFKDNNSLECISHSIININLYVRNIPNIQSSVVLIFL